MLNLLHNIENTFDEATLVRKSVKCFEDGVNGR